MPDDPREADAPPEPAVAPGSPGAGDAVAVEARPPRRALSSPTVDLGPRDRGRPRAPVPAPPPDSLFDGGGERFEPRGELGRGGMGRVEQAFDRALDRAVAIKRALRATPHDLARFAREARLTARLEHAGIVPIHDIGYGRDGAPYYIMRKVDGETLAGRVERGSLAERLALIPSVLAACDAVAFAHAQGIVHRDLKPHNILIGPFGETLVIDWGLARELDRDAGASGEALPVADDPLTAAGAAPGTPGFLAPEQARGEPVDRRADVFALGATLFHVLAGRPPHHAATATAMVIAASAGRPADWRALPDGVPADLRAILVKALAVDPAERYADAGELAADLRQFVTGNLVAARRYGALARAVRFVRRHRAVVTVAVVSALALAVVGVISVRRIAAERDDATAARALAEARQRDAVDTADRLLVARAQQLAATDPVGAIALLRRLDAGSRSWRDAWLAAAAAWARGIPSGFRGEHKLMWVQIAADDRRAVTASSGGDIAVYDLAARTRRSIARVPGATMCLWIGDHRVVCRDLDQRLAIVDTEHGVQRTLGVRGSVMVSDRRSRAIVETPDRQLVEIAGPDGGARTLAQGAGLAAASPDLDAIAVWRGDALVLWTPSAAVLLERFPQIAPGAGRSMVAVRDRVVAAIVGDEVVRWRVQGDRVASTGRWSRGGAVALGPAGGRVYSIGSDDLGLDGAPLRVGFHVAWGQPTGRGLAVVDTAGRIVLIEDDDWRELGPYPTELAQVERSRDGRFVVARSTSDELLVWDLAGLGPRAMRLEASERPVRLAPRSVWTRDPTRGLVRRALDTAASEVVLPGATTDLPGWWFGLADDGQWAAARVPDRPGVAVYDATRGLLAVIPDAAVETVDGDRLVFARADGVIARWQPGPGRSRPLGRLPAPPARLAAAGDFVVAQVAPRALVRLDLRRDLRRDLAAGGRSDATLDEDVAELAVARTGRAWFTTGGTLWRWELGAAPVRIALTEPVDAIVARGGRILAHTPRSLIALDVEPVRAMAIDARGTSAMAAGYLAAVSEHGELSVLDLDTGNRAVLPGTALDEAVVANGDTVMFATGTEADHRRRFAVLELAVPHDPAALRRWLGAITNAAPASATGDGGSWPSPDAVPAQ